MQRAPGQNYSQFLRGGGPITQGRHREQQNMTTVIERYINLAATKMALSLFN